VECEAGGGCGRRHAGGLGDELVAGRPGDEHQDGRDGDERCRKHTEEGFGVRRRRRLEVLCAESVAESSEQWAAFRQASGPSATGLLGHTRPSPGINGGRQLVGIGQLRCKLSG
jgi:hypothetical protein